MQPVEKKTVRLLFCTACRTLEEIADYPLNDPPELDVLLEELVMRHNMRDWRAHGAGATLPLSLMRVSEEDWSKNRAEIIKGINEQHQQSAGLEGYIVDSMNTFKEDAMLCYNRHHRPPEGCPDYWSDEKRIGRPTPEGRAVVAESYKLGKNDPHICGYCPVHTFVTTQIRFKRGMYKDQ